MKPESNAAMETPIPMLTNLSSLLPRPAKRNPMQARENIRAVKRESSPTLKRTCRASTANVVMMTERTRNVGQGKSSVPDNFNVLLMGDFLSIRSESCISSFFALILNTLLIHYCPITTKDPPEHVAVTDQALITGMIFAHAASGILLSTILYWYGLESVDNEPKPPNIFGIPDFV